MHEFELQRNKLESVLYNLCILNHIITWQLHYMMSYHFSPNMVSVQQWTKFHSPNTNPSLQIWPFTTRSNLILIIVLNIGRSERYINRYIVLEGLLVQYKSPILTYISDISSDIPLSVMKTAHPIRSRDLIFRTLILIPINNNLQQSCYDPTSTSSLSNPTSTTTTRSNLTSMLTSWSNFKDDF